MVDVPFDVVTEILSWVPARYLLRFRCVCRSWYALLHESGFIKLHLLRANQSNPTRSILYNYAKNTGYCVDPATSDEPVKLKNLPYLKFCSSCNGLVCTSEGSSITLWNPATREHKELPPPLLNSTELEDGRFLAVIGFGWEPMKDDYKVLGLQVLYSSRETKEICQFMVYTLRNNSWRETSQLYTFRTDSWREISQIPYLLGLPYFSTFFEGGLHSLVTAAAFSSDNLDKIIVSFDMEMEVFKEIHLPEHKNEVKKTNFVFNGIGVLQGCLSVVRYLVDEKQIDIWIMRRYGVEESWYKHFSIDMSQMSQVIGQFFAFSSMKLVGFEKSKLLLARLWGRGLISYDAETGRVEYVAIRGTTLNWSYLGSYVETLVSLNNDENKDAQTTPSRVSLCSGQRLKCCLLFMFFISLLISVISSLLC